MSTVLIVAEAQPDGQLRKATLNAIAAGRTWRRRPAPSSTSPSWREDPAPLAEQLKRPTARRSSTPWPRRRFAHYLAETYAPAVAELAKIHRRRASSVPPPPRRGVTSFPASPRA